MAGNKNSKNETSFKKGNTAALGNDKSLRLSTLLDKELNKPSPKTLDEYDAIRTRREDMASEMVDLFFDVKEPLVKKALFDTIADRTEGKPHQTTDVTSDGEKIANVVFMKPEKMQDEE